MKIILLGFIAFGDGGDIGDGDDDGDGGGGDGCADGSDEVDDGDGEDNGDDRWACGYGNYLYLYLVKYRSDLLEHCPNIQAILKVPRRSTLQEGSNLENSDLGPSRGPTLKIKIE